MRSLPAADTRVGKLIHRIDTGEIRNFPEDDDPDEKAEDSDEKECDSKDAGAEERPRRPTLSSRAASPARWWQRRCPRSRGPSRAARGSLAWSPTARATMRKLKQRRARKRGRGVGEDVGAGARSAHGGEGEERPQPDPTKNLNPEMLTPRQRLLPGRCARFGPPTRPWRCRAWATKPHPTPR